MDTSPVRKRGDWGYVWRSEDGKMGGLVRYTLRHRVRLLLGVHGQMHNGEYLFDTPPSWKYPRFNKFLNRVINLIPDY